MTMTETTDRFASFRHHPPEQRATSTPRPCRCGTDATHVALLVDHSAALICAGCIVTVKREQEAGR